MGKDSLKMLLKYVLIILVLVGVCQGEYDQLSINIQLVVGICCLFGYGSDVIVFGQKCYWVDLSFVVFKVDVVNIYIFGSDWQWYVCGLLQVIDVLLVLVEQFVVGGMYIVCGYLLVEVIGDYGGLVSLEWCILVWLLWCGIDLCVYSFVDVVYLCLCQLLFEQCDKYNLVLVGLGVQLCLGEYL